MDKITIFDYILNKDVKVSRKVFEKYKGDIKKIAEMRLKDRNRKTKNAVNNSVINTAIEKGDVQGLQRFEKMRKQTTQQKNKSSVSARPKQGTAWSELLETAESYGYVFNPEKFRYDSENWRELEDFIEEEQYNEFIESYDEIDEDDYFYEIF